MSDDQETRPAETPGKPRSGTGDDPGRSGRPEPSLFPPPEFVSRMNGSRGPGVPVLTALDPLAMLMWHTITRPSPLSPLLITGC